MILAHDLLLGPGAGDTLGAHGADAGHLAQAIRLRLDHVEHFLAERLDQLPRVDRADAADHPGTEILLDALSRRRRRGAHEARLELLPMGTVIDPFARCRNPFAGGDHRSVTDDGDQVAVAPRLDPENAKAVFGVVEGDPLDESGQNLPSRCFRLGHRRTSHEVPNSTAVSNSLTVANCRVRSADTVHASWNGTGRR
jgi:hypothetical protein